MLAIITLIVHNSAIMLHYINLMCVVILWHCIISVLLLLLLFDMHGLSN